MKLRLPVAGLFALPLLAAAFSANAIPVIGTSTGAFSSLGSCDNSGSSQDCRIVNGGKELQWGSQDAGTDFVNPSKLRSVTVNINSSTGSSNVTIGQLDWYNSATLRLSDSLDDLLVDWTLSLNFTAPSGPDASGGATFDLTIKNPVNPTGDEIHGLMLADLTELKNSLNLAGVSIDNLHYAVGGSGTAFSSASNYWYNDENNWASLYIVGDFNARGTTKVPEPSPLVLLGLGLVAAGAFRRRRATV